MQKQFVKQLRVDGKNNLGATESRQLSVLIKRPAHCPCIFTTVSWWNSNLLVVVN